MGSIVGNEQKLFMLKKLNYIRNDFRLQQRQVLDKLANCAMFIEYMAGQVIRDDDRG